MWHKAVRMGYPMRLELTREGLLVTLVNHYTTQGEIWYVCEDFQQLLNNLSYGPSHLIRCEVNDRPRVMKGNPLHSSTIIQSPPDNRRLYCYFYKEEH